MPPAIKTQLEVIVSTVQDAQEAEAGGADCLEIVRELEVGGLTPLIGEVSQILAAVALPARVMLRQRQAFGIHDTAEWEQLLATARDFQTLPIDGLVLGFIANRQIDLAFLQEITQLIPGVPLTFHRAFEQVADPLASIEALRTIGQVDRILVSVAEPERGPTFADVRRWQELASPAIDFIAGIGLNWNLLREAATDPVLRYVHVGRFARERQSVDGAVSRAQVARLKSALT